MKLQNDFAHHANKVHVFWEGHNNFAKSPPNSTVTHSQKLGEEFTKFCGLLRIYEL